MSHETELHGINFSNKTDSNFVYCCVLLLSRELLTRCCVKLLIIIIIYTGGVPDIFHWLHLLFCCYLVQAMENLLHFQKLKFRKKEGILLITPCTISLEGNVHD